MGYEVVKGVNLMPRPIRRRPPPLRRPGLRPPVRRPPGPPPHPALEAARREVIRANHLMEAGHAAEAAEVFIRISCLAEQRGVPLRASNLAVRFAHAFMLGGDVTRALEQFKRAVRLSVQVGDLRHAVVVAHRALAGLKEHGYQAEAQTLRAEFDAQLSRLGLSPVDGFSEAVPSKSRELPTQCPACLGPVRSDEVEWVNDASARCAFCGSILKAK